MNKLKKGLRVQLVNKNTDESFDCVVSDPSPVAVNGLLVKNNIVVTRRNGHQELIDLAEFIVIILPLIDQILFFLSRKIKSLFKRK